MLGLASVLRQFLPATKEIKRFRAQQHKVFGSIMACRTERLGASIQNICSCGHEIIAYNSCRDRHCPQCQGRLTQLWVGKQSERLLPVKYHHCVFTLPDELCSVARYNETLLYALLFASSSQTLKSFFRNDQRFGGKGAFLGILHTWGQLMQLHPHIHYIVACASLLDDGELVTSDGYLFNVRSLSQVFRGKYLQALERLLEAGKLKLPPDCDETRFRAMLQKAATNAWVVYTKESYGGPAKVVEHIGRYAHKVAISDSRILKVDEKHVTFQWKDYRNNGAKKERTVLGTTFIKRYAQHILPRGFHRIRYYGFWSSKGLEKALEAVKETAMLTQELLEPLLSLAAQFEQRHQEHGMRCPECSKLLFEAEGPGFTKLVELLDSS